MDLCGRSMWQLVHLHGIRVQAILLGDILLLLDLYVLVLPYSLCKHMTEVILKKQQRELDCPSRSCFVFTLQFIGSGPAENKLLRHDQKYLNFSIRILMQSHLCFFGMPTHLRHVIVLAFIHSYWAVILILSWEAVWGDCSNNWAWGDNNHCRYWLYGNWEKEVFLSFFFPFALFYLWEFTAAPVFTWM
jgi:hypothetical protein